MEASLALSITASVLRIVTISVESAKTLNDIRCAWKRAPVTVSSLCSQLKLTAASLSQIQSLLLNDIDILRNKPDLMETLDTTLTASLVLSTWLERYIQKITKGVLDGSKATWKMKFKTLWNEDEVKNLTFELHAQQGAVSTLVGLLQIDSISEIRTRVRRQEALLRRIAANTRFLRRTHTINAPGSILGTEEANGSIFSKLADREDTANHLNGNGFESIVLGTKVYSKAFTGVLDSNLNDESDDACTIVETDAVDSAASLKPSLSNLMRGSSAMKAVVERLGIDSISVQVVRDHKATNNHELNLTTGLYIFHVKKIDSFRYWGQALLPGGCFTPPGIFYREKVVIDYKLRDGIAVRTKCTCIEDTYSANLGFNQGETIKIKLISHGIVWGAHKVIQHAKKLQQVKDISVYKIDITKSLREDIDTLLQYFSCPYPKINSTSDEEFRIQVREIFRRPYQADFSERALVYAHCKSVAQLKIVSREYRSLEDIESL